MYTVSDNKVRLDEAEVSLLVEGLGALHREYVRMSQDAERLGYPNEASALLVRAIEVQSVLNAAENVAIERITVRFS